MFCRGFIQTLSLVSEILLHICSPRREARGKGRAGNDRTFFVMTKLVPAMILLSEKRIPRCALTPRTNC